MNTKQPRIARLVPPHADKNWSFQMINVTEDDVRTLRRAFSDETVEKARPFLQGNSGGWVMVEFWTDAREIVDTAARHFFSLFDQEYKEGDFTRSELGIEH